MAAATLSQIHKNSKEKKKPKNILGKRISFLFSFFLCRPSHLMHFLPPLPNTQISLPPSLFPSQKHLSRSHNFFFSPSSREMGGREGGKRGSFTFFPERRNGNSPSSTPPRPRPAEAGLPQWRRGGPKTWLAESPEPPKGETLLFLIKVYMFTRFVREKSFILLFSGLTLQVKTGVQTPTLYYVQCSFSS